jgi:hypothetical protein
MIQNLETYRSMVLIIVFIHMLPWNHISAVFTLLKVAGTVCRMQGDV